MPTSAIAEKKPKAGDSQILLKTLSAFKKGNLAVRMPVDRTGVDGKIADVLNDVLELSEQKAKELDRISRSVGKEGKIAQRVSMGSASGGCAECIESVN